MRVLDVWMAHSLICLAPARSVFSYPSSLLYIYIHVSKRGGWLGRYNMKMVPCVSVVGVCVDLLSLLLAGCLRVPPAHTSPEPRRPKRPHGAVPPEGRTPDDSITSPSPAPPGAHHWSWICPQVGHHWSLRWPQVGHHSEAPPT